MNKMHDNPGPSGSKTRGASSLYDYENGQSAVKCHEVMQGPPSWYKMNTRPKHLPQEKQQELSRIVETIRSHHEVEMVILFGSYARNDWVEDEYEEGGTTYTYRSDYDILIVMADKSRERDVEHDSILREALEPGQDGTRVNWIVQILNGFRLLQTVAVPVSGNSPINRKVPILQIGQGGSGVSLSLLAACCVSTDCTSASRICSKRCVRQQPFRNP
jgi:predicted nucleotidyltransferase